VRRGENHGIMNKWHQKFFMYLVRSVLMPCVSARVVPMNMLCFI
jgi:hypothetical protein